MKFLRRRYRPEKHSLGAWHQANCKQCLERNKPTPRPRPAAPKPPKRGGS